MTAHETYENYLGFNNSQSWGATDFDYLIQSNQLNQIESN